MPDIYYYLILQKCKITLENYSLGKVNKIVVWESCRQSTMILSKKLSSYNHEDNTLHDADRIGIYLCLRK